MSEKKHSDIQSKLSQSKLFSESAKLGYNEQNNPSKLDKSADKSNRGPADNKVENNAGTPESEKQGASKQTSNDRAKASGKEINGPKGLEPTRYGDWESKGRCYDF